MTDRQIEALREEMREGFRSVNEQLTAVREEQEGSFADLQQAVHGIMFKLLTASEINEIRSKMRNPPDIQGFPFWAIR